MCISFGINQEQRVGDFLVPTSGNFRDAIISTVI
jgi:hypothetical protein